jgi:hypothetical protein
MWHPDYGETTNRRLAAVQMAEKYGTRVAAEQFNVTPRAIQLWRKRLMQSELSPLVDTRKSSGHKNKDEA